MILGEYWKLHDDETVRKIDAAAVRLLTGSGARIEHDGLLDTLEGAGCRIDRSVGRCVPASYDEWWFLKPFMMQVKLDRPVGFFPCIHGVSHVG